MCFACRRILALLIAPPRVVFPSCPFRLSRDSTRFLPSAFRSVFSAVRRPFDQPADHGVLRQFLRCIRETGWASPSRTSPRTAPDGNWDTNAALRIAERVLSPHPYRQSLPLSPSPEAPSSIPRQVGLQGATHDSPRPHSRCPITTHRCQRLPASARTRIGSARFWAKRPRRRSAAARTRWRPVARPSSETRSFWSRPSP